MKENEPGHPADRAPEPIDEADSAPQAPGEPASAPSAPDLGRRSVLWSLLAGAAGGVAAAGIADLAASQRSDRPERFADTASVLEKSTLDVETLQQVLGIYLPEVHARESDRDDQAIRRAAEAASRAGGGTVLLTRADYFFGAPVALNGLRHVTFETRTGSTIRAKEAVTALRAFVGRADAVGADGEDLSEEGGTDITFRGLSFDGGLSNGDELDGAPFYDFDDAGERVESGTGAFARSERRYEPAGSADSEPRVAIERAIYVLGDLENTTSTDLRFSNISIENVRLLGLASLPIYLRGVRGLAAVDDSYAYRCLDIGFTNCENVRFSRNRIELSADNGVSISRGNRNVTCTGNIILKAFYYGIHLGGFNGSFGPQRVTCTGNTIVQCGATGINLYEAPRDITITGNFISDIHRGSTDDGDSGQGYAILLRGTTGGAVAKNIVIVGNNIARAHRGGVCISSNAEDVLISGNSFQRIGLPKRLDGGEVSLDDGRWNTAVSKPGRADAASDDVRRVVVTGNAVFEDRRVMLPEGGPLVSAVWGDGRGIIASSNYVSFEEEAEGASLHAPSSLSFPRLPSIHDPAVLLAPKAGSLGFDPRSGTLAVFDGETWRGVDGSALAGPSSRMSEV